MELTARVLLPGRLPDGSLVTWSQVAQLTRWGGVVDGYTDWSQLVELRPGVDSRSLPVAAAGWVDADTGRRLVRALGSDAHMSWTWWPFATWSANDQSAAPDDRPVVDSLAELTQQWQVSRFGGRASDGLTIIEAPSYADSLIVSGGPDVVAALETGGLEVHPVSRTRRIPIWRD